MTGILWIFTISNLNTSAEKVFLLFVYKVFAIFDFFRYNNIRHQSDVCYFFLGEAP